MFAFRLAPHWKRRLALITVASIMFELFVLPLLPDSPFTVLAAEASDDHPDCDQIADGLVACYPFNGNANDESGNRNHALQINATLVPDRFGNEDKAYSFDGIDDYIEVPFPGYLKNGTISTWVNIAPTNTKPNSKIFIISHALGENGDNVSLNNENNVMEFGIYYGRWHYASSGITPEKGKWYHFAGTWGDHGLKIYVNGKLEGTNLDYAGGVPHGPAHSYLGTTSWPSLQPSYIMEGIIDDVRIYNRALTDEEIQQLADRTGILPETGHQPFKKAIQPECADECPGCNQTPDGLVAWYPFDGNANDASGHGNHGMVDGARLIDDRQGRAKSAYHFDGVDDAMKMGDSPLLNPHDALTVSCWVYLRRYKSGRGEEHNLIVKDDFNDNERDYLLTANYQAQFVVFDTDNIPGIISGGTIELLKWHHIVGTYDGSKLKLYVDGMLVGSRNWNGPIHDTETPLRIGETNDSRYERALNGNLDDIRIYNRALTDEEIQQLADRTGIVTETDHLDINNAIRPDCKHQPPRGTPRCRQRQGVGHHSRGRKPCCR